MFFNVSNKQHISLDRLRTDTLLNAYFVIQNYPLKATDVLMDQLVRQRYGVSLKNMCIKLLLSLTFHKNDAGDLILVFKNYRYDTIASLITYGNGVVPGSKILQKALKN